MTQQNAASISSVFTPALLGAIAYFVVFEYLRTRWTTFYAPKFKGGGIPHPGLFRWIPGVLRLSESDVIEACGTDAAIYLRFQRMCGFIMAALGVLACIILMPIYSKGANQMAGVYSVSIGNLGQFSDKLWAPAIMAWVFSAICFYFITTNYMYVYDLRRMHLGSGQGHEYTVMITGIPETFDDEDKIREFLEPKYPNQIVAVQVIRNEAELETAVADLRAQHIGLMQAQTYKVEHKGQEGSQRRFCCMEIKPIEFHVAEIKRLESEIERLRSRDSPFVGVAFATFSSLRTAAKAASTSLSDFSDVWTVGSANKPSDIVWENVSKPRSQTARVCLSIWKTAALGMIYVFWSIPVAFVNAFSNLNTLADEYHFLAFLNRMPAFWKDIFTGFVPSVLLVVLMLVLRPILIYLIKMTGLSSKSTIEMEFARTYYRFLLIDVFFITLISTSIYTTLQDIIENPKHIFPLLGNAIPAVAIIEIEYIIVQTFLVEAEQIVRIWKVLTTTLFTATSTTDFEKQQATKPEKFLYGYNIAFAGLIFSISMCYSCIAPLILPFAVCYYAINYVVNKYKLVYVHTLDFETHGLFWPTAVRSLFIGMITAQLALMGVIGLKYGYYQQTILFPLPILSYLLSDYLYKYFGLEMMQPSVPLSKAQTTDTGRSPEKVREYLLEWHRLRCWAQPAVSVDVKAPLKPPRLPPQWNDVGGDRKDAKIGQVQIQVGGDAEHAPLLSAADRKEDARGDMAEQ